MWNTASLFRRSLIPLLCLLHTANLDAATAPLEDAVFSDDSTTALVFKSEDSVERLNEPFPSSNHHRISNSLPQSSSFSRKTIPPPSADVVKHGYEKLNALFADDTLDEAVLIVKEVNEDLNRLNQNIEQQLAPAMGQLFIIQDLFAATGEDNLMPSSFQAPSTANIGLSAGDPLESLDLEDIAYDESDSFFAWLLKLPSYLFDIENLIILGISLFLLTGFFKVVHYVVNRIY
ncbi:hypothetical protein Q9L42_016650 [Methylomarinum sp. Ch1-1]|uniref:Uncharacterized protein n=1 Tax=Methylomarinum roseum TaxID=3067653 RepID=A0AAU7NSN6_9GAMM|nr:hypothetical protein [Methylomarinum sp. Ch1-1]MDP4520036.1 hypothetical protein [Methylomarinum sp. Ch1-1]